MKDAEFKEWLIEYNFYSSRRQVSDCVSRARRVRNAYRLYDVDVDAEFDRDGAITILSAIVMEGHTKEHAMYPDLDLPFESPNRSMGMVCNSFKKYIAFRALTENKFVKELSENKYMKRIMANCQKKMEA